MNTNINILERMLNKKGLSLGLSTNDFIEFSEDAQAYEVEGVTVIDDVSCYIINNDVACDEVEAMNIIMDLLEEE